MDSLSFNMVVAIHSGEWVCSIMDNYTMHLLLVSMKMEMDSHSLKCTMGDQLMAVMKLTSMKMGGKYL